MWCITEITDEYIQRMLNILEIYERSYDPLYPVVCFDEKSKQLLDAVRMPISAKPGRTKRIDYEYRRNGTVNLFVAVEPKGKFHSVQTTKRRTKQDFAKEMKRITELPRYKNAKKIHFVLDNLNIHFEKSFYETFSKTDAENILKKIELHYTPKHASWLNMAEIEINVLSRQCLNQQISTFQNMQKQTAKWSKHRNEMNIGINWQFTRKKAKAKFRLNSSGHKN